MRGLTPTALLADPVLAQLASGPKTFAQLARSVRMEPNAIVAALAKHAQEGKVEKTLDARGAIVYRVPRHSHKGLSPGERRPPRPAPAARPPSEGGGMAG